MLSPWYRIWNYIRNINYICRLCNVTAILWLQYTACTVISRDQHFALLHKYFMNYVLSAQWLFRGLSLLRTGLYFWCFVFRYSEILIISAWYIASNCNKSLFPPFLFRYGRSESAFRWCSVYIFSISQVFLSSFSNLQLQVVVPKLYLNTRTANAPVAVILFLAFSSNYIIIPNLLVYLFSVFLPFVDLVYLHLSQFSVPRYLYVLPAQAVVFLCWCQVLNFATELFLLY